LAFIRFVRRRQNFKIRVWSVRFYVECTIRCGVYNSDVKCTIRMWSVQFECIAYNSPEYALAMHSSNQILLPTPQFYFCFWQLRLETIWFIYCCFESNRFNFNCQRVQVNI
jgi:hypothetical protein